MIRIAYSVFRIPWHIFCDKYSGLLGLDPMLRFSIFLFHDVFPKEPLHSIQFWKRKINITLTEYAIRNTEYANQCP
jgi:hypothetical protein